MKTLVRTAALACMIASPAAAVEIQWTDWQTSATSGTSFSAYGLITSGSESIDVTYTNPNGVGFYYTGQSSDIDYWRTSGYVRDSAISPYTSTGSNGVDNIPTSTDIIALRYEGTQTLSFSQSVGNLVFAFVSLNGNGYAFDQDFELLSSGSQNLDGNGTDACGYWGCGTSSKEVVEVSPGVFEYRLIGTGEPHGALRFSGSFEEVSWRSLTNEYWNGFTVGVQGTSAQVFPSVPLPAAGWLLIAGLGSLAAARRRRS